MKKILLIILLLIVGCSKPINENSLIDRNGVKYQQDSQKPYSGKVFRLYDTGENKNEGIYKDGKLEGLFTQWYENGQKEFERTYKDGKPDGLWTYWNDYGQKEWEGNYKDGELVSSKCWDQDGNECECHEDYWKDCK